MASPMSQKLEEKLVCSICLELFRVPVTLPCGHNFCKRCIGDHWDKQKQAPAGTDASYTCPECRRGFEQCPELEKNVTLCSVVELARDSEARGSAAGRCEVAPGELCPQHGRPLELYCQDERRCICCVCTVRHCQQHRRVLFEEERAKKQVGDKAGVMGGTGMAAQGWQEPTSTLGMFSQRLDSMILEVFSNLNYWCLSSQNFLKESLEKAQEESERIELEMKELEEQTQSIKVMLQPPCAGLWVGAHWFSQLFLPRTPRRRSKLGFRANLSAPPMALLFPDHRNLTFNADTANKYLKLSKGARKAKHGTGAVHGQERGPRFEPWQVLCTQSYGPPGHHYWEVKISSHSVVLGVTYRGLPRGQQQGHGFNIGLDGGSWGLQVREDCYLAWHEGRAEKIREQLYTSLGVSLDYGKGLLSFYGLGERTQLIHSFHGIFTEPLYPVFWLCEGRAVTLLSENSMLRQAWGAVF
uniref:Tripartite motif containing 65 n=1 Tax=Malurus cyaneus samueli TaxID=2593467 RepID=A0A8C5U4K0_9PASS